jgi:hypothetical protein
MADLKFLYVKLDDLISWFEEKLSEKYSVALEGIGKRFISVYSHFEGVLHLTLEVHDILKESSELNSGKIYLDNMM